MSFTGLLDTSCEISRKVASIRSTGVSAPGLEVIAYEVPCALQMQIPVLAVSLEEFQRVSVSIWLGLFQAGVDLRAGDRVTAIGRIGLPRPTGLLAILGPLGGGGVWTSAGTRGWRLTAFDGLGETIGSVEAALNVTSTTRRVTLAWTQVPRALGYRLYRTELPGGPYGDTSLRAVIDDPTITEFVDDGSSLNDGRAPLDQVFEAQAVNRIRQHHLEATLRLRSAL